MQQPASDIDSPSPAIDVPARSRITLVLRALGGASFGIAIAAGAAYVLGVKPDALIASLVNVPVWAAMACIASGFVVIALQTLRWSTVMRPLLGLRYTEAYRVNVAVAMLNALIPARGGDLLRVAYFGKRTGKSRATILGREIVDRWLDMIGWIPTFLLVCAIGDPPGWLLKALGGFGAILVTWAVVMIVLARRGYRPKEGSRLGKLWSALKTGIDAFRTKRTLLTALFIAPLPWLWETFVLAQVGAAFGLDLTLVMAFSLLMAFNLAMAIPTPGAVGTAEAGGTAALVFFGFDQSAALAFMLVYRMAQLIPAIVAGATVLAISRLDQQAIGPANTDRSEERGAASAGY